MKISTKLTIQTLLIAVIPLLILGGIALYEVAKLAEREFVEKVSRDGDFHQQQIERYLSEQVQRVEKLSTSSQISALLSRIISSIDEELLPSPSGKSEIDQAIKEYLDHYFWREVPGIVQNDAFRDLHLISNTGEVLYSYDTEILMGASVHSGTGAVLQPIWNQGMEQEGVVVEPFKASHKGELLMYLASPIYSWNELMGVVVVEYSPDWIAEQLEHSTLLGESEDLVVVADLNGEAAFLRGSRYANAPCAAQGGALAQVLTPADQKGLKGVGWRVNAQCREVMADWRYLPLIGATMVVSVEREEVLQGFLWMQTLFLSLIGGVVAVIFLVSLSASHMITRRIVLLKEHALEIAKGDLQQKIGDYGHDEVGLLADALRSMMKTIRDRTRTLERANQLMQQEEQLREQLIQQRTRELFEANSYMEKIFSTMRDVLIVLDDQGCIKMVNPAAMELLGYSESELQGSPVSRILNLGERTLEPLFTTQQLSHLQHSLQELAQFDHANFQRLVENSPLGIIAVDQMGVIDLLNSEAERIFGCRRAELYGESVIRLLPQWGTELLLSSGQEIHGLSVDTGVEIELTVGGFELEVAHGLHRFIIICDSEIHARWEIASYSPVGHLLYQEQQQFEISLKGRENGLIPVELSCDLLRDSNQSHQGYVLVMWDLRVRKALEAKSNEAAYQGGLGEMSATILHNIGNVVTGLEGSAFTVRKQLGDLLLVSQGLQQLKRKVESPDEAPDQTQLALALGQGGQLIEQAIKGKIEQNLEGIEQGVQHVADIITLQQGLVRGGVWATEFNLRKAIDEVVAMQLPGFQKSDIACVVEVDESIEQVKLPRGPFQQMLVNFLKNSREAIEMRTETEAARGVVRIAVRALLMEGEECGFQLSVSDNGIGISDEQSRKIFDSGFTTKPTGSGLGLHSAATFVQSVGGRIEIGTEQSGASIKVQLPCRYQSE